MFDLYERNRTEGIPNFITEDFLLVAYCLVLDESITEMEEQVLLPKLDALLNGLLKQASAQRTEDPAIRDALNYLCVLAMLLGFDPQSLPILDTETVAKEVEMVQDSSGIAFSQLMKQRLDYSQFKVRGKYTRNADLVRYFKATAYARAALFPVLESNATGITSEQADHLTAQALFLARTLMENSVLRDLYQNLTLDLSWLFGPAEDLSAGDYMSIALQSERQPIQSIRKALHEYALKTGAQPEILSAPVDGAALEEGVKPKDVLTGWRLLPARFSPESAAFQQLVFDRVTTYLGGGEPFSMSISDGHKVKGFPMALELMALMDSKQSELLLRRQGETNYYGYGEAFQNARKMMGRSAGLSSEHLRLISLRLQENKQEKRNDSQLLRSCLAFWTYLRHSNVLYANQSYTMAAKSLSLAPPRSAAGIEPSPELYRCLQDLTGRLAGHFRNKRMIELGKILANCTAIAQTELRGNPLSKKQMVFLNQLDHILLDLTGRQDHALVVDVHTESNSGLVLYEAIGYPILTEMLLAKGSTARGGLLSYYEFKFPMKDRLTDSDWQALLTSSEALAKIEFSCAGRELNRSE